MRPLAVRAALRYALSHDLEVPTYVCPPCKTSHGDWLPGERYPSHARVELTRTERDLTRTVAQAVAAGDLELERVEKVLEQDLLDELERPFP